jgi:hypothetical protein
MRFHLVELDSHDSIVWDCVLFPACGDGLGRLRRWSPPIWDTEMVCSIPEPA